MKVSFAPAALIVAAALASGSAFAAHRVIQADVAIVGSGFAGMTAAVEAAEKGRKVVVLEKMGFPGGASMLCGGQYAIQGTEFQKSLGVPNDPPQSLVHDLIANGHLRNNLTTLDILARNSPRVANWAIEKFNPEFINKKMQYRAEFQFDRTNYVKGYCAGFYPKIHEAAKKAGAQVLLNTKAEELLVGHGRVRGVKATSGDDTVEVRARAVLLATGGYGANKDMLVEPLKSALYYGPISSTGDGHKMAQKIGAQLENMDWGKRYPNGVESAPGRATSVIQGNYRAWLESGFLVNKDGRRVVNEKASNHNIMTVLEKQPGQTLYLVMDDATWAKFVEGIKTAGVTDQKLKEWLDANGSKVPVFAHGKTLEEAAQHAGVNGAELRKTLTRYNELVKAGKDEDFGRPAAFLKKEAKADGAFHIVEQKPRFATTMGSVVVDRRLHVLDALGRPIPGLYAAGEITNAVHGDDSAPGMNMSWTITSGKVAAENIVRETGRRPHMAPRPRK